MTNVGRHLASRARISSVVVVCLVLGATAAQPAATAGAATAAMAPGLTIAGELSLESCAHNSSVARVFAVASRLHLLLSVRQYDASCAPDRHAFALDAYSTTGLNEVGTWPLDISDVTVNNPLQTITLDQDGNRAFVAFDDGHFGSRVAVIDLSRLDPAAGSITPTVYQAPGTADAKTAVSTDDPTGGAGTAAYCASGQALPGGGSCMVVTGSSYDAVTNSLDVMESCVGSCFAGNFSTHGPQQTSVYLSRLDATTGALRWMLLLGQCSISLLNNQNESRVPLPDPTMAFHSASGNGVAAGCLFSHSKTRGGGAIAGSNSNASTAGGSMMTYIIQTNPDGSLALDANRRVRSDFYIGRPNVYSGLPDPSSGRMFFVAAPPLGESTATSAGGPTAVGFDVSHHAYVGATTVGSPPPQNATGFDLAVAGGRIYSVAPDGVLVSGTTSTPQQQGLWFPLDICGPGGKRPVVTAVQADAATRRIFAQASDCDPNSKLIGWPPRLVVYQDSSGDQAQDPEPNPDSLTQQIPEQAGKTQRQFGAHGESTGARFRLVGGVTGLEKGGTVGAYDLALQTLGGQQPSQLAPLTRPDFATREMLLGQVRNADVSNYQSTAESLAADIDQTTAEQLKSKPAKKDWPYAPADCSSPGNDKAANSYAEDTRNSVACDLATYVASASADAGPAGFTLLASTTPAGLQALPALPMLVGQSHSEVHVKLDPATGLVADTIAEARSVTTGAVFIRSVQAESYCVAHGRTGTAGCTYTRTVSGVTNGGKPVGSGACKQVAGPAGTVDTCAILVAQLNTINPGTMVFSMPSPDDRYGYYKGSPGGRQAVAQRELYAHAEDNVLNYDSSVQVPGLHMVYNNDTPDAPSRVDVQLANVQSETHYGISLATYSGDAPAGSLTDALPPVAAPAVSSPITSPAGGSGPGILEILRKLIQQVLSGLAWLFRSPLQALLMAGMLTLFGLPIYLAVRRRRLEALGEPA